MKHQLELLLQMQTCDGKVRELAAEMTKLPAQLDTSRRDLAKLEAMVVAERTQLTETQTWRKAQEAALEREQESYKTAKIKLNQVKNSKEYAAASREVDSKKKSIADREAELKKVGEAMTASATSAETHGKDVETLRAHLAEQEAAIAAQLVGVREQHEVAVAARTALRDQVDKALLKTYDTLSTKRGYAVAMVVKGVCRGCHVTLPPQLNNILARMVSIESCPRCGRIVYREEMLAPPVTEGAGEPPAPTAG